MIFMINLQIFLTGLIITSTFTGLTTEAVKKVLDEHNKTYQANTLAGIIALVLSICVGVGYVIAADIGFTTQAVTSLIALVFMSWLCSMVGYDKVIQTISQIKNTGKDDCDE